MRRQHDDVTQETSGKNHRWLRDTDTSVNRDIPGLAVAYVRAALAAAGARRRV